MLTFIKHKEHLYVRYSPQNGTIDWAIKKLANNEDIHIKKTFFVNSNHLRHDLSLLNEDDEIEARIGTLASNGYYDIDSEVLGIDYRLRIHASVKFKIHMFIGPRQVSVFRTIARLSPPDIWIGGQHPNALSTQDFTRIVDSFPNDYELGKYVEARICAVSREHLDIPFDGEADYQRYLNKKVKTRSSGVLDAYKSQEVLKYRHLLKRLQEMLNNSAAFSEKQWQTEILKIILLLYPKYVAVIESARVKDYDTHTTRIVDLMLADSSGNIDIVEIKQPFDKCIVSSNRYRDNHIPIRDLSGTIMQIEKYLFYLNQWGKAGEITLSEKHADKLPKSLKLRITNPNGLAIIGRSHNLSARQLHDFEIIKRKYRHIVDIVTYDELIRRLKITIEAFSE